MRLSRNGVFEIGGQDNVLSKHTISIAICVWHSQLNNLVPYVAVFGLLEKYVLGARFCTDF